MRQARFGFGLQFDDPCRINDLVFKYKSKKKGSLDTGDVEDTEELPRYSSFKEGPGPHMLGRLWTHGIQLPASSVIVPAAECLTQGHILSWSVPHSVIARFDSICMSDRLHPSGDILNAHSIPELFLRQSSKAALQINFFLCSILLSSPLFCWR